MDSTKQIIGIDQGNANIKTSHCIFPANFMVSCVDPGILDDTLKFNLHSRINMTRMAS